MTWYGGIRRVRVCSRLFGLGETITSGRADSSLMMRAPHDVRRIPQGVALFYHRGSPLAKHVQCTASLILWAAASITSPTFLMAPSARPLTFCTTPPEADAFSAGAAAFLANRFSSLRRLRSLSRALTPARLCPIV